MHQTRRFFGLVFALVLILTTLGCDSLPLVTDKGSGLSASGIVETVEVTVAPEFAGRVVEILAAEGDSVHAGDLLFQMDDQLLQSQRQRAITTLESAKASLSTAKVGLQMADATLDAAKANLEFVTANAEIELLAAQNVLSDLYDAHEVSKAEAQKAIAEANRAVREAKYQLYNFTVPVNQKNFETIEAIAIMEERLDEAREAFEPYRYEPSGDKARKEYKEALDEAQSDYDAAVRRMEYETAVEQASATLDKASKEYETLQDGPDPDEIVLLEARIAAAKVAPKQAVAAVEQAEVGLEQAQAQLEQAEKTVAQAQAALDLIDTQINKLSIVAPVSGVVMVRNIELGEVLQPGVTAMTIGQLDKLTVTVYIPEDRYGQVDLGNRAQVRTDSFPGETFDARVMRIADRAEYTPRNVQTKEDRATTVFAIKLDVIDTQGKLKPGMPVDVDFIMQ